MTNEELKKWLINIWNSCYAITYDEHPDSIYLYYDKSVVRKMKLCKLNNIEFKQYKVTGICLFEQDFENKDLICDYYNIWSFVEKNYIIGYPGVQSIIENILKEYNKLNQLTPVLNTLEQFYQLEEQDKLKIL